MALSHSEQVKFLHPVGLSTCKYGISIPLDAQTPMLQGIAKGCKVPVTILCDGLEPVQADVRRLNNKARHLQIRYELKSQKHLRQYLASIFGNGISGNLLKIEEIAPWTFRFQPILKSTTPSLQISNMLLHRLTNQKAKQFSELDQIRATLEVISYDVSLCQADYNYKIRTGLENLDWQSEQRVIKELGLKSAVSG